MSVRPAPSPVSIDRPQRVESRVDRLGELLADLGVRRPMLVVARQALRASGLGAVVDSVLGAAAVVFDGFTPNPTSEQAEAAAAAASVAGADGVVGIGGGSCCDVAKVAAIAAMAGDRRRSVARGASVEGVRPLPLVLVPTTSGTGSEATHFAAIYVDSRKVSVAHPAMRPACVVLDERFHLAMPSSLAAVTGLDALSQAIESMWAVGATAASLSLAEEAARASWRWLVPSVQRCDPTARREMMRASHAAGGAINLSKTTASHAMSYVLTQRFGIPHGHAVALTLGHLAARNAQVGASDCAHAGGADVVRRRVHAACACAGVEPAEMPATMAGLMRDLGLAASLRGCGVDRAALAALAPEVDPVRLGNNPVRLSAGDVRGLLEAAYEG